MTFWSGLNLNTLKTMKIQSKAWWGAPRKFSTETIDRKVSWLELFYDLVYVIAIAKITHQFSENMNVSGFLDYLYFFIMIFWGWLNGSLYHDLHGSEGLRTRLMTLCQMLIVASLVIVIGNQSENLVQHVIIVIIAMQLLITYMWYSVGFYDKNHRKLRSPYILYYLISLALMFTTFFLDQTWLRIVFFATLFLNYCPPFITHRRFSEEAGKINLSSSMTERLGLFTIIIFGEVIAGVINGVGELHDLTFSIWVNFVLAIFIVFALWWMFFTLVADRPCKPGFLNGSLLEVLYIPTLISLGLIGLSFHGMFDSVEHGAFHFLTMREIFGHALCLFILGMITMPFLLEYPIAYAYLRRRVQLILLGGLVVVFTITMLNLHLSLLAFLGLMLVIILTIILLLNYNWYSSQSEKTKPKET